VRATIGNAGRPANKARRQYDRSTTANNDHAERLRVRFGFAGIEFGNWMQQRERKTVVETLDAGLVMLAQVLGVDEQHVGKIGGGLTLSLGARGRSRAAAHFEPGTNAINLARNKGSFSLVHEYGHALDKAASMGGMWWSAGSEWQVATKAMPIFRAWCRQRNDKSRVGGRPRGYWTRPEEMFARSFEGYVLDAVNSITGLREKAPDDIPCEDERIVAAPIIQAVVTKAFSNLPQ
jgi:hypothetical protein